MKEARKPETVAVLRVMEIIQNLELEKFCFKSHLFYLFADRSWNNYLIFLGCKVFSIMETHSVRTKLALYIFINRYILIPPECSI